MNLTIWVLQDYQDTPDYTVRRDFAPRMGLIYNMLKLTFCRTLIPIPIQQQAALLAI
jgi:hypothetical protein